MWEFCGFEPRSNILMMAIHTPPLSSHGGSCQAHECPCALRGHSAWEGCVLTANGPWPPVCCLLLARPYMCNSDTTSGVNFASRQNANLRLIYNYSEIFPLYIRYILLEWSRIFTNIRVRYAYRGGHGINLSSAT